MTKPRPSFPARLDRGPATGRVSAATTRGMPAPAAAPLRSGMPASGEAAPYVRSRPAAAAAAMVQASDYSAVRRHLVSRLVAGGLSDAVVLAAMGLVERHLFVDGALRAQAYEDTSLPIGLGQTISKPAVVARMIALLNQGRSGKLGRVLEIGTGCGYQAAVLSHVATEVYSIERLRGLHDRARENLRTMRLPNVHLLFGDGMVGYAKGAPYAGIIAAAGGDAIPPAWTEQLAVGGRLVAPVAGTGNSRTQQAIVVVERTAHGLQQNVYESVHFVPLKSGVA